VKSTLRRRSFVRGANLVEALILAGFVGVLVLIILRAAR
jgi:hypothetical protein